MTWESLIQLIFKFGIIILSGSLIFLISVFLIATAMYIFPAMQIKHNLRQIEENEIESRIYLDEYKFTIANKKWNEEIENKSNVVKDLDSKIRKKAAELKSLNAQTESKTKPIKMVRKINKGK